MCLSVEKPIEDGTYLSIAFYTLLAAHVAGLCDSTPLLSSLPTAAIISLIGVDGVAVSIIAGILRAWGGAPIGIRHP